MKNIDDHFLAGNICKTRFSSYLSRIVPEEIKVST